MEPIKRGEIYLADLNPVTGSEQGGIRPAVILQNDIGNQYSNTTIIASISGKTEKHKIPTHISVECSGLYKPSTVLLEQIRTVDKCRLLKYIGVLDNVTLKQIDKALITSFGLNYLEEERNERKNVDLLPDGKYGKLQKRT